MPMLLAGREREELNQIWHSNMSDKLDRRDVTSVCASFLEEGMTLLELETEEIRENEAQNAQFELAWHKSGIW